VQSSTPLGPHQVNVIIIIRICDVYSPNLPMDSLPFPITFPPNAPMALLSKSPLIPNWARTISSFFQVDHVGVISADAFGPRIGCCELDVSYTLNGHHHCERIILHGKAVIIAVVIRCTDTNEVYTILVHQPRIGAGRLMYEFPAGMADDSDDLAGVAAREVEEEIGMKCAKEELIALSQIYSPEHPYMFMNPSHYEQSSQAFLLVKRMTRTELADYEGRYCGVGQDEQITLHVVPFADVVQYAFEPATLAVTLMVTELLENGRIEI
jgi:8-oxo-dGTP pyrophosphatase MutT (NUDIX family)